MVLCDMAQHFSGVIGFLANGTLYSVICYTEKYFSASFPAIHDGLNKPEAVDLS